VGLRFETEDCQLRAEREGLCLETVLRFPNDGVIGPYFERHHGGVDPGRIGAIVEIGYIYIDGFTSALLASYS
jgi:hypothetical protein